MSCSRVLKRVWILFSLTMGVLIHFFQINEFLEEVTQFQEEQSEALLWRNHASVHHSDSTEQVRLYSQAIFWYCRPLETRLDLWLFFDHLPAHQRDRNILYSLKSRVSFPSGQLVLNKSLNSLRQPPSLWLHPQVSFQSILSLHYSKPIQLLVAPLPIRLISLSLWSSSLDCIERWRGVYPSSIESLDDSLISLNVHIPSSYPHIVLCHFSCDITHEFTPRINLKNFSPSQWSTLIDCLKSLWDLRRILWGERFFSLESACNISTCQCVLVDFLTSRESVMRKEKKIGLMNLCLNG